MHKRIRTCMLLFILALLTLLSGCRGKTTDEAAETYVYYVNLQGTGLEREPTEMPAKDTEEAVADLLTKLTTVPESTECTTAFPEGVSIRDWEVVRDALTLNLSEAYAEMDASAQILLQAAVVETLTQLDGIYSVEFLVQGEPLTDADGQAVGALSADDFVSNTGVTIHSNVEEELPIYFSNADGDRLVRQSVTVSYNTYEAIEKVIMEALCAGPQVGTALPTLPAETTILSVSLRNNICYINLDDKFLEPVKDVAPDVVIYAIVDSVLEAGNVSQVQILVNGETDVLYQDQIDLSRPFTKNWNMIEE